MSVNKKVAPLEPKGIIQLPLEECFELFLDYRKLVPLTEWLKSVTLKNGDIVEEGTIFVETKNVRNNDMVGELVLNDVVENESFKHIHELPKMRFEYHYRFRKVDDEHTEVDVETTVIGRGFSKFTAPMMAKEINKETARIIKDLVMYFEEEA